MDTLHITRDAASPRSESGVRQMATRVLITGIAVFLAIAIVPGIGVESRTAGVAAVLVLTVLNLLARPMLYVLSFPFIVLSLGLFIVVINALLLGFTAFLVKGFSVDGFWPAVGGAIVISLVTMLLQFATASRLRVESSTFTSHAPRPPKMINPAE